MERVITLNDRLQEQVKNKASLDELLITVQMLQSELQHLKSQDETQFPSAGIAIHIPSQTDDSNGSTENKSLLTLEVNEEELNAELEAMKKIAEAKNIFSIKNRRPFYFDPIEDTPTLSHQTPVSETQDIEIDQKKASEPYIAEELVVSEKVESSELNESLKSVKKEVSDLLQDTPIKDLKKGIGINDRFLFINELFQGDESMYERSIKTINGFSIFPEAEYWIRRELKTKLGWDDKNEVVRQFDTLVKRRFL